MEKQALTIVWTDPAKYDLQSIYDYLAEISILIAENQIDGEKIVMSFQCISPIS